MKDIFDMRIGKLQMTVSRQKKFIKFGWNKFPVSKSFGWLWIWIRGVGNYSSQRGWARNTL